jgi:hypothetical protein
MWSFVEAGGRSRRIQRAVGLTLLLVLAVSGPIHIHASELAFFGHAAHHEDSSTECIPCAQFANMAFDVSAPPPLPLIVVRVEPIVVAEFPAPPAIDRETTESRAPPYPAPSAA